MKFWFNSRCVIVLLKYFDRIRKHRMLFLIKMSMFNEYIWNYSLLNVVFSSSTDAIWITRISIQNMKILIYSCVFYLSFEITFFDTLHVRFFYVSPSYSLTSHKNSCASVSYRCIFVFTKTLLWFFFMLLQYMYFALLILLVRIE